MAIRTDYTDAEMSTYFMSGSITGGTLIRYTIDGVNHTVSILTTDTTAVLALLNSLNIGIWIYDTGIYYCYYSTKDLIAFRVEIGNYTYIGSGQFATFGIIDDLRISNVTRDANWVLAEYNNQNSPSTFFALGTEGAVGTAVNTTNFFQFF